MGFIMENEGMDLAKIKVVGVGGGGSARQGQTVAQVVGEVLDLAVLVVVAQEDGVQLALEAQDLGAQVEGGVDGGALAHARLSEGCQGLAVVVRLSAFRLAKKRGNDLRTARSPPAMSTSTPPQCAATAIAMARR